MRIARSFVVIVAFLVNAATSSAFVADAGGRPEKPDVVVTYAQPSGT